MVMSIGVAPVESVTRKRIPLVSGSMTGEVGIAVKKLPKLCLSSVAGASSLVRVSFCLLATVGTMLVHGSHASPNGSLSLLACEVFATATQLSMASHTVSPSVSGNQVSAGQLGPAPVQVSATSHVPVLDRQTVLAEAKPSAGHVLLTPSQLSATSQTPAAPRHTAVLFPSGGHAVPTPSHVSATSHTPPAPRHTVAFGATTSGGQSGPDPLHRSATSHGPAAGRQMNTPIPLPRNASGGHAGPMPSQCSAASHTPAAARHTVLGGSSASGGHAGPEPEQCSATSQT